MYANECEDGEITETMRKWDKKNETMETEMIGEDAVDMRGTGKYAGETRGSLDKLEGQDAPKIRW